MRKCVFHKISSSGDWRKASVTCSLNLFLVIINQSEELEFHHRLESSSKPKTPRRSCLVSKKRTGKKPLFSFWQVFFSFPLSLSLDPLCRPADGRHAGEDEGGQSADRGTGCTYSCSQQKRLTRGKKKDGKGARDSGTSVRWSVPCMAVEAPCLRNTPPVFCSYPLIALCLTQQTFR